MIDVNTLPACPVETTLTLISDKWKILIVRDLLTGTKRFVNYVAQSGTSRRRCSPRTCDRWKPTDLCIARFTPKCRRASNTL